MVLTKHNQKLPRVTRRQIAAGLRKTGLKSGDVAFVHSAMRTFGRCGAKAWPVADKAFSRLQDDALAVRELAIKALQWATNTLFEYNPEDPPEKRAQAIRKIKAQLDPARPK